MTPTPQQQFDQYAADLQAGLAEDQLEIDLARVSQQVRVVEFVKKARSLVGEDLGADDPIDVSPDPDDTPQGYASPLVPTVPTPAYVAETHEQLRNIVRSYTGPVEQPLVVRIAGPMPHAYVGGYSSLTDGRSLARADRKPLRLWLVVDNGVTIGGVEVSDKFAPTLELRVFGGVLTRLVDQFSSVFSHERSAEARELGGLVIGFHGCKLQPGEGDAYGDHGSKNAVFFNPGTDLLHLTDLETVPRPGRSVASWEEHFCYAHSPNTFVAERCTLEGAHRTFFQLSNRIHHGHHEGDHVLRDLVLSRHGDTEVPIDPTGKDGGQAVSCWGNPYGRTLIERVKVIGSAFGGLGLLQEGPKNQPLLNAEGWSHDRVELRDVELDLLTTSQRPAVIVQGAGLVQVPSNDDLQVTGAKVPLRVEPPAGDVSDLELALGVA